MKRKLLFSLSLLVLLTSMTMFAVTPAIADSHDHDDGGHDAHDSVENNCHDPTTHIRIAATEEIGFNATEFTVEKGECVMFMFINAQTEEHDFALKFANGTEYFGLHIVGNGTMQMKAATMQMPKEDTVMPFICTVEDHEEQGMTGQVIVGAGLVEGEDRAPGFGFVMVFSGFLAILLIVPYIRKR